MTGCDCTELCEMGPTCPGGMLAELPSSGCWRTTCAHEWLDRPESDSRECLVCGEEVNG